MSIEKQRLTVLNRLSAEYPSFVCMEAIRHDTSLSEHDFMRVAAYLQEKAFIELDDVKQGGDGVFGKARITAAGLDFMESRNRQIRATVIR